MAETNYYRRNSVRIISREQEAYPERLRRVPSPPRELYVIGRLPDQELPAVAIIGARVCSEYGRAMAGYFGRELARYGVQIVSGMARGIDSLGQWGAIEGGGFSFGVLGSGVDVCYPAENRALYERLRTDGGLISEQPCGTQPKACYFPARNRMISGLSDLVLVIEARVKSGTQITVDMALEQGREVAVVPGRLTDSLSEGCNQMIRQGAQLVTGVRDVLEILASASGGRWKFSSPADAVSPGLRVENKDSYQKRLEKKEKLLYSCLDFYPVSLDEIVNKVAMPVPEVLHILLQLKLKGCVRETGKHCYIKCG